MNGLKGRIERLQETLNPEPATMITIIIHRFDGGVDPVAVNAIGKYAFVTFMGGTLKEQRREVKRLRASGIYDRLPHDQPAIGEGEAISGDDGDRKAIGEGETT